MSKAEAQDDLPPEWATLIESLREDQGMVRCSCGRYYHPHPGSSHCGVCDERER